jgi:signal transduction histidine kinase
MRFPDDEVGMLARGLEALLQRIREFIVREQEFTRDASHELRTPLAVIRSAGECLMPPSRHCRERGRQHVDHIRGSAAQLEQTVATLLIAGPGTGRRRSRRNPPGCCRYWSG